ncbi:MAG: PKD domain-containing protein [bacterium]
MNRGRKYLMVGNMCCCRALATMVMACVFQSVPCGAILYVSTTGNDITGTGTNPAYPYATIQKAIESGTNGASVYVSPGTYYPTSTISVNKKITIIGTNGPSTTIVNAGGSFRCAIVKTNATLAGLTITGGYAAMGGGFFLSSGAMVSNCIIQANTAAPKGFVVDSYIDVGVATNRGGGIFIDSSGLVVDSTIANNFAANDGGGVFLSGSGQVLRCTISGNRSNLGSVTNDHSTWFGGGGGVYILTNGLIYGSLIQDNRAKYRADGGGVYCAKGGVVSNCTIAANQCGSTEDPRYGGGLLLESKSRLLCSIVKGNYSGGPGGGVYADTNSSICDSVVQDNSSDIYAGGIYAEKAGLTNCTVIDNALPLGIGSYAGGLYATNCAMANMVVYFNSADAETNYALRGTAAFTYSCADPLPSGMGNTNANPLFVDFPLDYHLALGSPCINKGIGRATTEKDIDGHTRKFSTAADIGADEYVTNASVIARTTAPYMVGEGAPVTLRATNSSGANLQYRWSFGDGSTPTAFSTSGVITHAYTYSGSYTGRLFVANTNGQSLANFVVAISNIPPTISLSGTNYAGILGQPLLITASACHPVANAFQYRMHFASQAWSQWSSCQTTQVLYASYVQITNDVISIEAQKFDPDPEVSACFGATGSFSSAVSSFSSFTTLAGTPLKWLNSYGLTNDTSDVEPDGMTTWEEYIAGTDPTKASSVLALNAITPVQTSAQMVIAWNSASNRWYDVFWSSNLLLTTPTPMASGIGATPPINVVTDTIHSASHQGFYFIKVKLTP